MPQSNPITPKELRIALRNWNSIKDLGNSPLTSTKIVQAHQNDSGYSATSTGLGLALQEVLQNAIDALKPVDTDPQYEEKRWRPFIILTEQFIHGRSPVWLEEQLHISKGSYFGDQRLAFDMLASIFQRWEETLVHQSQDPLNGQHKTADKQPIFLIPPRPIPPLIGLDTVFPKLQKRLIFGDNNGLTAISGLPGVGKTTLVLELAYNMEIRSHFKDGVLWIGLGQKPDLITLLGGWAEALGISGEKIRAQNSVGDLSQLIHQNIGAKHMLLIIDDAWQIESALAFKIGGPNCAHILTSRSIDIAIDFSGKDITKLSELSEDEGLKLLSLLSPEAVNADSSAAKTLVNAVGGLPLAINLMGRYLQKQSNGMQSRRIKDAISRLMIVEERLNLSQAQFNVEKDKWLSIQAVIGMSKEALDTETQNALLDLAVFLPKPNSFSEEAALAVIHSSPEILDKLVDCGLVETVEDGRYTMHQTIADYGRSQKANLFAQKRMINYFVRFVETNSSNNMYLEKDLSNILSAIEQAYSNKLFEQFIRIILTLYPFLEIRGFYPLIERNLLRAYPVASIRGDHLSTGYILFELGDLYIRQGKSKQALDFLQKSIDLAKEYKDLSLEANSLFSMGLALTYTGDSMQGKIVLENALLLDRQLNRLEAETFDLNALGYTCVELCQFDRAKQYLEQALQICEPSTMQRSLGWAHFNLMTVYLPIGDFDQADIHAEQCQKNYHEINDKRGEAWIIYQRGRISRQEEHFDDARKFFEQSISAFCDIGDQMGQGYAVHNLGLIDAEQWNINAAFNNYQEAEQIFQNIDCIQGKSQCLYSQGVLFRKSGDLTKSQELLENSLSIRRQIHYSRGESMCLANLALVMQYLGLEEDALKYSSQAVQIAKDIQAEPSFAYTLTIFGHILSAQNNFKKAKEAYRHAAALRQKLHQTQLSLEPLAGLANTYFKQGDLNSAKNLVENILPEIHLAPGPYQLHSNPVSVDTPARIYLFCYQIQQACFDPSAKIVLNSGVHTLENISLQFSNEDKKSMFWENIPSHRALQDSASKHLIPSQSLIPLQHGTK